jgi:hypothetical protein
MHLLTTVDPSMHLLTTADQSMHLLGALQLEKKNRVYFPTRGVYFWVYFRAGCISGVFYTVYFCWCIFHAVFFFFLRSVGRCPTHKVWRFHVVVGFPHVHHPFFGGCCRAASSYAIAPSTNGRRRFYF